jgi:DNA-binding transcriptional regulator GbsR (MarR family)
MDEIDKDFIEMYQSLGGAPGFDELLLTLFAKLYIEPEDMAMDDLAKETGYSLASICNKVKLLESMGVVKRMRKPGSKKIFLYTEKSFIDIVKDTLMKKEELNIKVVKEKVPVLINKYKKKARSDKDKRKLKILEDYYEQIIKFERLIKHIKEDIENM